MRNNSAPVSLIRSQVPHAGYPSSLSDPTDMTATSGGTSAKNGSEPVADAP